MILLGLGTFLMSLFLHQYLFSFEELTEKNHYTIVENQQNCGLLNIIE